MTKDKLFPVLLIIILTLITFSSLFTGKLPIPSDTIVGLYHPYRDFYASSYPRGIPFKNFLITDPVRQQYPWRLLALDSLKKWELPIWNPYNFAGTPLMGNLQHAVFYPLNLLFYIFPTSYAWSLQVLLQIVLAFIFMYFYVSSLKLHRYASVLSALSFALSGFAVAWLEWNTIVHVWLWLPLILLSIDKVIFNYIHNSHIELSYSEFRVNLKGYKAWALSFLFALLSSFFAGHLQTFFYVFIVQIAYLGARLYQQSKKKRLISIFVILYSFFFIFSAFQWFSIFEFISLSARSVDIDWYKAGWFIPWQHFIQFIVPDFFGNPSTLNYWGEWNYGEFVGYIGLLPIILSVYAIFFRYDKKTFFFGSLFFLSLIFAFPTLFAKIPFLLSIPFFSTAQPTRLISISCFSLAILAGLGADYYLMDKKRIFYSIGIFGILIGLVYMLIFIGGNTEVYSTESMKVALRNTFIPSVLYIACVFSLMAPRFLKIKKEYIMVLLIGITLFDLLRFYNKFTPFTDSNFLFPSTKSITFLQKNIGYSRIMSLDNRIFPPNFSIIYKIPSIEGYDPMYLRRYGELITASERGAPDISPPFGFNRIISPKIYTSHIIDLIGVKYFLTLNDINDSSLKKVFQEGETRIYENLEVFPKVFFVSSTHFAKDKNHAIDLLFNQKPNLRSVAIVEGLPSEYAFVTNSNLGIGVASIKQYRENKIVIETTNKYSGFLVLMDSYYPSWKAQIDGENTFIYRTNYNFRGIFVPAGSHKIIFFASLI